MNAKQEITKGSRVNTKLGPGTVIKTTKCDPFSLCPAVKVRMDKPTRYKLNWFSLSDVSVGGAR